MDPAEDHARRFGGLARLYGAGSLDRLRRARVAVVGVGGVGSWAVEALARSGVGRLTLIDPDDVCVTNTNRQLPALVDTVGQLKVEVLAARVRAIQPGAEVEVRPEFFGPATAEALLAGPYDWVIDAIDALANKCRLLAGCRDRGWPVVTVGGAGGKRDPTAVRVADLAATVQDELLRQVRKRLRREHGFTRDPQARFGIPCVFSAERTVYGWADGTVRPDPEPATAAGAGGIGCEAGLGTAAHVTAAFGLAAAGVVVGAVAAGH